MKKRDSVFLCGVLFWVSHLQGHGFGHATPIKRDRVSQSAETIFRTGRKKIVFVSSYDIVTHRIVSTPIQSVGQSICNCYVRISLDQNPFHDISCTPSQEFYDATTSQWIPACQIQKGIELVGAYGVYAVQAIQFIKRPLKMYALEVKGNHNYFVGAHALLTHNMLFPAVTISVSAAFGAGAAVGGQAGSFLGPITCAGGIVLGGIIGIATKAIINKRKLSYRLHFDVEEVERLFLRNEKKEKGDGKVKNISGEDDSDLREGGLSNKEARKKAKEWGYKETKDGEFGSRGKLKFIKGNSIISPDRDGHNGGHWKEYNRKNRRIGTLDHNGKRIKS